MRSCQLTAVLLLGLAGAATLRAQAPEVQLARATPDSTAAPDFKLDPNLPPSEILGDALNARGRYLAALHVFEQLQPRTPVIANKIGVASEHMRMFDRAKLSFDEAIRLDANYSEAYNNLGTVYHSQGDLGRAEKLYKRAIKLKPQSADSWQNLGTLYYSKRKFKKGEEAYHEALKIDPQIFDRSAQHGIQAAGDRKNSAEMHYHLACTFAKSGNSALALDYLRKCILEGFHDKNRMLHDKELADLQTTPVFLKMVEDLKNN